MGRTEFHDVTIAGGQYHGLRMRIRERPNGEVQLDEGGIFFPRGLPAHEWDRDAGVLRILEEINADV